jgi:hypothetical protein
MTSSGMLHCVALGRTEVSEERSAPIIRVTRIGGLEKTLAVTSNRVVFLLSLRRLLVIANIVPNSPLMATRILEGLRATETSVLTRAIRRNILEDGILHSHRRENPKFYVN